MDQRRAMDSTSLQNNPINNPENVRRRAPQEKREAPAPSSKTKAVLGRVEPMSAYLSDSSTSAADSHDDEESIRLGISRFSIEKPTAPPNLSFRTFDAPQVSSTYATPFRLSPILPNDEANLSVVSKSNSVLSALRHSPSILDAVPSEEEKKVRARENSNQGGGNRSRRKREHAEPPLEQIATRRRKGVSPRSNNETFNNIVSMFEDKPAAPIVPPNETWQYSGSNVGVGTKHQSDAVGRRSSPRFA